MGANSSAAGISLKNLAIASCILALIAFAAIFAFAIARVFLLIFAGIVIAVFLNGCGAWLAPRLRVRYGAAVAIVIFASLAGLGLALWLVEPRMVAQFRSFQVSIPRELSQLTNAGQGEWKRLIGNAGSSLLDQMKPVMHVSEWIVDMVVIAFVAAYLAFQPGLYREGLLWLLPARKRASAAGVLDRLHTTLWRWFIGRIIGMAAIGILVFAGMRSIGFPLAFALGLVAALFEFVPYAGAIVSSIPAILLALPQGTTRLWIVVGIYLVVHGIDGYVVIPLVERRAVRIAPALTITAQVAMFSTAGLLGVLIADPLVATILVLLERVRESKSGGRD